MNRFVTAAALAVLVSGSALAADLPRQQPAPAAYKAPVYAPYSWTGAYVGLNGGGAWGRSDWNDPAPFTSFNTKGAMAGLTLGYNWQAGATVFGVEADGDWSNLRGSSTACVPNCETRNNWLATARARLGYAMTTVMPYITGGAAFGDIQAGSPTSWDKATKVGWTAGAGLEASISGPWTVKIEYLYVDLGSITCGLVSCGAPGPTTVKLNANVGRAGINYRF